MGTPGGAPPQFSPDGQWWWDGRTWLPAAQAPQQPTPQPTPQQPLQEAPVGGSPTVPQSSVPQAWGQPAPYGQQPTPDGQQPTPYGQQPAYPNPYGQAYDAPQSGGTDAKAITSLVLSIVWLLGLGSIAAVILGHLSRSQAKKQGRSPSGIALAGLIIGYLGVAGTIGAVALGVVFANTFTTTDTSKLKSDLRKAAVVEEQYHAQHGHYADDTEFGNTDFSNSFNVDVYVQSASDTGYCLSASNYNGKVTYYLSHATLEPTTQAC